MTHARRVDANQREIVAALIAAGASVLSLHRVGVGAPDLLVGFRGVNYLLEAKTAHGALNELQREWHAEWRGQACVVRSVEDALMAIGAIDVEAVA